MVNGELTVEGRKIASENLKVACDEVVASVSKPADPKKDAKSKLHYKHRGCKEVSQEIISGS